MEEDRYQELLGVRNGSDALVMAIDLWDRFEKDLSEQNQKKLESLMNNPFWAAEELDPKKGYRISIISSDKREVLEIKYSFADPKKGNLWDYEEINYNKAA